MADDPERGFPSRSQRLDGLISACQDHSKHCRYCTDKYDHGDVYRQMWAKLMDAIDEVIVQVSMTHLLNATVIVLSCGSMIHL